MPRRSDDTRRRILDAAYGLFYRGGFAKVGVDAIAEAAGITKRTLYYHFESKDALVEAVLDAQHALILARVTQWIDDGGDNAAASVRRLFVELANWCRQPRWRGSGFSRAAIEYADAPGHPARRAAKRHKAEVERAIATTLERQRVRDASATARELMLLLEGCNALVLIHGDARYADAAGVAAGALIERRLRAN